jgi:hypothetical protein
MLDVYPDGPLKGRASQTFVIATALAMSDLQSSCASVATTIRSSRTGTSEDRARRPEAESRNRMAETGRSAIPGCPP